MKDDKKAQALHLQYLYKNITVLYGEKEVESHFKKYTDKTLDLNSELVVGTFDSKMKLVNYRHY